MQNKSIFTLIYILSILIGQDSKPTVAILDFEGQGVDASEVQTLSERMRTEIGNTKAVRLIERKAGEKIMQEQGLQRSGCTTDECAAEVGQRAIIRLPGIQKTIQVNRYPLVFIFTNYRQKTLLRQGRWFY